MPTLSEVLYPFLLLSAVVSLTMNLRRVRVGAEDEARRLRAQIGVLEGLVEWLKSDEGKKESNEAAHARVKRHLELVGLRERNEGEAITGQARLARSVTWKEVLLGRKDLAPADQEWTDEDVEKHSECSFLQSRSAY